jgi:hypothetical protein
MELGQAEQMGKVAATRIRQLVPPNPIHFFLEKIKKLIETRMRDIRSRQCPKPQ